MEKTLKEFCKSCGKKVETEKVLDKELGKKKIKCLDCGSILRFEKRKKLTEKIEDYLEESKKYYVGRNDSKGEVFLSNETPTELSHGNKYKYVIGPFRTKKAADLMAKDGYNNPHLQTVSDAERLAKSTIKENNSTFYNDGYKDAIEGKKMSLPDSITRTNSSGKKESSNIYKKEYLDGYNAGKATLIKEK